MSIAPNVSRLSRREFLGSHRRRRRRLRRWRWAGRRPVLAQPTPPKYGADGMPNGVVAEPARLRRHRRRRHRHHHLPPLRDGPGHAHRRADDRRRRAGGRLGARARRAGAGRRGALRQPEHRRLAHARATSSCRCAAAARRRGRCSRPRPPRSWGVPAPRCTAQEPPAGAHAERPHARLSARSRADAAELPVPADGRRCG